VINKTLILQISTSPVDQARYIQFGDYF